MQINTISLCPKCFMEIPAKVFVEDHVWMQKRCEVHGEFTGMVERDSQWFNYCLKRGAEKFYDGVLVDVTSRCNISCKYCYHNSGTDRDKDDVVQESLMAKELAPIILTGGEPTVHPDFPEILHRVSKQAETWFLTNGVNVSRWDYFQKLLSSNILVEDILRIGLSFHKESKGKDLEFLELLRAKKLRLGTSFYVIDDLPQIQDALAIYRAYRDVLCDMRIKAASNLWNEQRAVNKIYTSDMLQYLCSMGQTELNHQANNKVSYACVTHDGMDLKLISWYDKWNVDLMDISGPPFYRAQDGQYYNMVTACLKNNAAGLRIVSTQKDESLMYRKLNDANIDLHPDGVCRATKDDVDEVSYLWEDFIRESMPSENPNRELWAQQVIRMMDDPDYYMFIARAQGAVVGFQCGSLWRDAAVDKLCVIGQSFYVKPEYRNTAIAPKLHRYGLKQAKAHKAVIFRREVDDTYLPFWEKKGYKKIRSTVEAALRVEGE